MQIHFDTTFLFLCAQHDVVLEGAPDLCQHPNPLTWWMFDLSQMWCPMGNDTEADTKNNCQSSWTIQT